MPRMLEDLCREKLSELLQAVLEAEVDAALERLRYGRRSGETKQAYSDGHDRSRTITSNRGPIEVRRPRARGAAFKSEALPAHRRRLQCVDQSVTGLWLDGLATHDFEGQISESRNVFTRRLQPALLLLPVSARDVAAHSHDEHDRIDLRTDSNED